MLLCFTPPTESFTGTVYFRIMGETCIRYLLLSTQVPYGSQGHFYTCHSQHLKVYPFNEVYLHSFTQSSPRVGLRHPPRNIYYEGAQDTRMGSAQFLQVYRRPARKQNNTSGMRGVIIKAENVSHRGRDRWKEGSSVATALGLSLEH